MTLLTLVPSLYVNVRYQFSPVVWECLSVTDKHMLICVLASSGYVACLKPAESHTIITFTTWYERWAKSLNICWFENAHTNGLACLFWLHGFFKGSQFDMNAGQKFSHPSVWKCTLSGLFIYLFSLHGSWKSVLVIIAWQLKTCLGWPIFFPRYICKCEG